MPKMKIPKFSIVLFALGLFFLFDGEFQAFLGATLLSGIVLYFSFSKQRRQQLNSPASMPRPHASPSIPPSFDESSATFGVWDCSIHGADGQDLRFDRALYHNIVIESRNQQLCTAQIRGSHGEIYQTTLDSCTCEDFQRRGLPCKHIYKLALSHGFSPDAFFSSRSDVVWYVDNGHVFHVSTGCRSLQNRFARRTTVTMAEYKGLHPCRFCF